jgi:hypothetical protein
VEIRDVARGQLLIDLVKGSKLAVEIRPQGIIRRTVIA